MPLIRRSGSRFTGTIWTGFVDAMTALLLVLIFLLTIFMIVQYILRETISDQDVELAELTVQFNELGKSLGLEQQKTFNLTADLAERDGLLAEMRRRNAENEAVIVNLTAQGSKQSQMIDEFMAANAGLAEQVAALNLDILGFLGQNSDLELQLDSARQEYRQLESRIEVAESENTRLATEGEVLLAALEDARDRIAKDEEAARLANERRSILEALVQDLRNSVASTEFSLAQALASLQGAEDRSTARLEEILLLEDRLNDSERRRLAEEAAAALLLSETESERNEIRDAQTAALEQIALLESRLADEQESRFSESQRLAARIAALQGGLEEKERGLLIEAAAGASGREVLGGGPGGAGARGLFLSTPRRGAARSPARTPLRLSQVLFLHSREPGGRG
ncbi:MAG: hypothetical protein OXC26_03525, partial [Albidovulum sp.]|nr:hypothetical protein [Albidovulum sp.]